MSKFITIVVISAALALGVLAISGVLASELGSKDELDIEFTPAVSDDALRQVAKPAVKSSPQSGSSVTAINIPKETPEPSEKYMSAEKKRAPQTKPQPIASVNVAAPPSKSPPPKGSATKTVAPKDAVKKSKVASPKGSWFPWFGGGKDAKGDKSPKDKPKDKKVDAKVVKKEKPLKDGNAPKKAATQKPPVDKKVEPAKPAVEKKAPEKKEAIKPAVSDRQGARSDKKTAVINKWFGMETGVKDITARRSRISDIRADRTTEAAATETPDDNIFTLKDCISIAIKNSIPLQTAQKSVKLADMRVLEARRNMLPSATVVFEPYSGKVGGRNYLGRKQYVEGKQPIFHGGELYFTMKQAETNLEITRGESDKIKNELIFQVKKAYYALAKAEDNLLMQTELSGEVERILQMVYDQYDAKVASKLEYLNVTSQSSQIKYQFASADGDVSVAELMLKQAMNIDPEITVKIRSNLEFDRIKVKFEEALSAALVNRPEIRINLLMLEYYRYGKRIMGAKTMPKIDIMGSWGLARENYTPQDNGWAWTGQTLLNGNPVGNAAEQKLEEQWYAGVKTSIPMWGSTAEYSYTREQWTPVISAFQGTEAATNSYKFKLFDNLAVYSDLQLSEIDYDRARQELHKIRQDITLEVKEQCFNYQKALIQLDTASNKVRYQENDLELAKVKRGLDEMPDSGVIESMIKLSQERFGYVQALTDCHTSVASINKAIGIEDYYKDGQA